MRNSSRPLLLFPTVVRRDRTIFKHPFRDVEITIPRALSERLISACNGMNSASAVKEALDSFLSSKEAGDLLRVLERQGCLCDSRNIAPVVQELVRNPSPFAPNLSKREIEACVEAGAQEQTEGIVLRPSSFPLASVLNRRHSERRFAGEPLRTEDLAAILWSACGFISGGRAGSRTVPSGGALYPLRLHVVLLRPHGDLAEGAYAVGFGRDGTVVLKRRGTTAKPATAALVDPSLAAHAAALLVVTAEVGRSAKKYGNRGVMYSLLEAGHAAQNALLTSESLEVAAVELGGFLEKRLAKALRLSPGAWPLTTVLLGGRGTPVGKPAPSVKIPNPIRFSTRNADGYALPFHMAFAHVPGGRAGEDWSCGRDPIRKRAARKAFAESVEWQCAGMVPPDLVCASFHELGGLAIHPHRMLRYAAWRVRNRKDIRPFSAERQYEWAPATDGRSGEKRYVLADFLFFPYDPPKGFARYAYANSSGVAAQTTEQGAYANALLELVERDAFMLAWLSRARLPRICRSTLPGDVQNRLKALERSGASVSVLDASREFAPVILLTARDDRGKYFSCAAASAFDPDKALEKALMELEASVFCHLRDGPTDRLLTKDEVRSPGTHALWYERRRAQAAARFLEGDARREVKWMHVRHAETAASISALEDLIFARGLRSYVCKLGVKDGLHVVRALVPGLVPMTFGYGLEPIGLSRVQEAVRQEIKEGRRPWGRGLPPHPFN